MKVGIGLPESLACGLRRSVQLDLARLADAAGFHTTAVRDVLGLDLAILVPAEPHVGQAQQLAAAMLPGYL